MRSLYPKNIYRSKENKVQLHLDKRFNYTDKLLVLFSTHRIANPVCIGMAGIYKYSEGKTLTKSINTHTEIVGEWERDTLEIVDLESLKFFDVYISYCDYVKKIFGKVI